MKIYVPFTGDIITVGHIKFLKECAKQGKNPIITIGLLTDKALRGYKKCAVPFKDRKYILEHLFIKKYGINIVDKVVPQNSLNPYRNLMKYKQTAIASGDGWEKEELEAIEKWRNECGCEFSVLDIKLLGEKKKKYSSTKIKKKICDYY